MFSKKLQNLDVNAKSSLGCCCFGGRRSQSPSGDEEEKIKLKGDNPKSRDKSKKKHRKSQQNVDGNICDPPKDNVDGCDITKQQDETKKTNGKHQSLLFTRPGVLLLGHFLYGVYPRPYPAIYVFVMSWKLYRLTQQEMLSPPGHLAHFLFYGSLHYTVVLQMFVAQ